MKISILSSSKNHPIYSVLAEWAEGWSSEHDVALVSDVNDLSGGDVLFLIACGEIVQSETRSKYKHALVVHASALPRGRGWSPHIWQIIEGESSIPVTLLEAEDSVDCGAIWAQERMELEGHELYDEINSKLFSATLRLMNFALENVSIVQPYPQENVEPTYYRKRTMEDSRLDPNKTIAEQFNLLRTADPDRYPCLIEYRGKRYSVRLKKVSSL